MSTRENIRLIARAPLKGCGSARSNSESFGLHHTGVMSVSEVGIDIINP